MYRLYGEVLPIKPKEQPFHDFGLDTCKRCGMTREAAENWCTPRCPKPNDPNAKALGEVLGRPRTWAW